MAWTTLTKVGDQQSDNTTLAAVAEFAFATVAGKVYIFEAMLLINASTAGDLQLAAGEDATARGGMQIENYDATSMGGVTDPILTTKAGATGLGGDGGNKAYHCWGVHVGAGGTFDFLFANSSGTGPAILRAGSLFRYEMVNP